MRTEYFRRSQRKKSEIEDEVKGILRDFDLDSPSLEKLGAGSANVIYRIPLGGKSVALRVLKDPHRKYFTEDFRNGVRKMFESYCQEAERLYDEKKGVKNEHVVDFCIGIYLGIDIGVITEDITENGEYEIENFGGRETYRYPKGRPEKKERVHFDFGMDWPDDATEARIERKYMKLDKCILVGNVPDE